MSSLKPTGPERDKEPERTENSSSMHAMQRPSGGGRLGNAISSFFTSICKWFTARFGMPDVKNLAENILIPGTGPASTLNEAKLHRTHLTPIQKQQVETFLASNPKVALALRKVIRTREKVNEPKDSKLSDARTALLESLTQVKNKDDPGYKLVIREALKSELW